MAFQKVRSQENFDDKCGILIELVQIALKWIILMLHNMRMRRWKMRRVNSDIGDSIDINQQWLYASLKRKCKSFSKNMVLSDVQNQRNDIY